jgi:hypothetical protein
MSDETAGWAGWAIVELMGHRRLAGHITEETIAGAAFLRLDIPCDPPITQLYAPASVYCITPTTEDIARRTANLGRPAPVSRYELASGPSSDGLEEDDRGRW